MPKNSRYLTSHFLQENISNKELFVLKITCGIRVLLISSI